MCSSLQNCNANVIYAILINVKRSKIATDFSTKSSATFQQISRGVPAARRTRLLANVAARVKHEEKTLALACR